MTVVIPCLLAACHAIAAAPLPSDNGRDRQIAYASVLDGEPADLPQFAVSPLSPAAAATESALEPQSTVIASIDGGLRLGKVDVLKGGKLLLTNGISTVEGASGGGLARWATIAGRQMPGGIGISGHTTAIELNDFGWRSYGVAVGFGDRLELSFARADFDTRSAGALLGLGQDYIFNQEVFGAKLRVAGDLVYGDTWLPQIAVGIEHKRGRDGAVVRELGAADEDGTDYTLSATKLFLSRSLLVNTSLRYTAANQLGLLGFGSGAQARYRLQFEGSLGYQLSRRAIIGAEYRSKPDNLGLGEGGWMDLFLAYALTDHLTLTSAYVDLGSIATFSDQRGVFLSGQVAF